MSALLLSLSLLVPAEIPPAPRARVEVIQEEAFGATVRDPYRWLEDLDSTETRAWMRAQADHARAVLDAIPRRAAIRARLDALERATPARVGRVEQIASGKVFFVRRAGGEQVARLFVRDGWEGDERQVFDPASLDREGSGRHALNWFRPSPSGERIAIGTSASGSEQATLRVLEVATGRVLDGPIERVQLGAPSWLDEHTLLLHRFAKPRPGAPDTDRWLHSQVWRHRVGAPEAQDAIVFGDALTQKLPIAPQDFVFVEAHSNSDFVIGLKLGAHADTGVFTAERAAVARGEPRWTLRYDFADGVRDAAVRGDALYALVRKGSANGRVERVRLRGEARREVIYEGHAPLDGIGIARDAIYLREREGVYEKLLRLPYDGGAVEEVAFDARGSFIPVHSGHGWASPDRDGLLLAHGTWTRSDRIVRVGPGAKHAVDTGLAPPPRLERAPALEVEDLVAISHDGTRVPLTLVRPSAAKRDGTMRVLLEGYGSYGMSITPYFDTRMLAWSEAGFARAHCHARGGGELGDAWHRGGFQQTKANTWKDFIACAERLVERGWTTKQRLVGVGTSAGGILIGNAMIERPDLFAATIVNVGVTDTLRAVVASKNGPNHYAEYGDPRTAEGHAVLRANSAYLRLRDGVRYPPALIVHGVHDVRVDVWLSSKFAARLAAATTGPAPLLRLDYEAGHGVGSTANVYLDQQADWLAFALHHTAAGLDAESAP